MGTERKKAFLLYCDYKQHLELLSAEECGLLFMLSLLIFTASGSSSKTPRTSAMGVFALLERYNHTPAATSNKSKIIMTIRYIFFIHTPSFLRSKTEYSKTIFFSRQTGWVIFSSVEWLNLRQDSRLPCQTELFELFVHHSVFSVS